MPDSGQAATPRVSPLLQSAAARRCATCNRWHGPREPGPEPDTVLLPRPDKRGVCIEGPWHKSRRYIDNACGYWVRWARLEAGPSEADAALSPPPPP